MAKDSGCCNKGLGYATLLKPCLVRGKLLFMLTVFTTEYEGRSQIILQQWMLIQVHRCIQELYTGCQCLTLVMNFIILDGMPAAPATVIIWLHVAFLSCFHCLDTLQDPRAPTLHKVVEPEDIIEKTGLAYPHTPHCLANGDIMVSFLGDNDGNAKGCEFLLLDSDFNVKGRWEKPGHSPLFGYDFWYQPRHKTMVSSSWAVPYVFTKKFNIQHVAEGLYGRYLHVYSWPEGELKQIMDLRDTGLVPLELRFLHNPAKDNGFVGCGLSSNIIRFFKKPDESWDHEVSIWEEPLKVQNWILPEMPGLITDIVISLDDRFLYLSNWFHGDVRQYNIEDLTNPRLTGQVRVGGLIRKGSPVVVEAEDGSTSQFDVPEV